MLEGLFIRCFMLKILPALFALLLLATPAFAADEVLGTIIEVQGDAVVKSSDGKSAAKAGTELHLKDTVITGPKSKAVILFIDDSQFTLAEKSTLRVREYSFSEGGDDNSASYSVDGAFGYIGGLLGKQDDPDVTINTNYGSIGIRGTTLYGGSIGSGYSVFLQEGGIGLKNGGGKIALKPGQGTDIPAPGKKPGAPESWPKGKIKQLKDLVKLKDPAGVQKRINAGKAKNKALRKQAKATKGKSGYSLRMRNLPRDGTAGGRIFIPCVGGARGRTC